MALNVAGDPGLPESSSPFSKIQFLFCRIDWLGEDPNGEYIAGHEGCENEDLAGKQVGIHCFSLLRVHSVKQLERFDRCQLLLAPRIFYSVRAADTAHFSVRKVMVKTSDGKFRSDPFVPLMVTFCSRVLFATGFASSTPVATTLSVSSARRQEPRSQCRDYPRFLVGIRRGNLSWD